MADRNRFESLTVPLLDGLYRTALALAGNESDARDLVQATYLKALERFDSYREGTHCRAWMMTILRNTWTDHLRHRRVAGPVLPLEDDRFAAPAPPADPPGLGQLLEKFADAQVIAALSELPEPQRLALFLSDVEGLDQLEVAAALDVPVGTVKSRLSRARAALREKLQDHAADLGFLGRRPCRT